MIARRTLLASTAMLAVARPGNGMTAPADLRFDVTRNGSTIGTQSIAFAQQGESLRATTTVDIVVKFGPVVLYRYSQSAHEIWRGSQFESLESTSNDDGKPFTVHATRGAAGVTVDATPGGRVTMPEDAIPLTHWNILCMQRPLFNPQDGTRFEGHAVQRGEEMVPLANGTMVRAMHYSLVGKLALDDWYDDAKVWTALRSLGTDGSKIEYRRMI